MPAHVLEVVESLLANRTQVVAVPVLLVGATRGEGVEVDVATGHRARIHDVAVRPDEHGGLGPKKLELLVPLTHGLWNLIVDVLVEAMRKQHFNF